MITSLLSGVTEVTTLSYSSDGSWFISSGTTVVPADVRARAAYSMCARAGVAGASTPWCLIGRGRNGDTSG